MFFLSYYILVLGLSLSRFCVLIDLEFMFYDLQVLFSNMSMFFFLICPGFMSWMAQLEEAWTVNRDVDGSSFSCVKLTKSLQQTFNSKIAGFFGLRPKLGGPMYHNIIVGTLKIHLCLSHTEQVLRLPGAVSPDMLHFASLRITLTVPEVVGAENGCQSPLIYHFCLTQAASLRCSHSQ